MFDWGLLFFLAVVCLLLVLSVIAWNQPRAILNSAQYEEILPGYQGSADRFFALVYERLQSDLTGSRLPFSAVGFGPRPLFAARHILSARPVYLEVRYEHLSYFLYATPAPAGLYVSTWLFSKHELWQGHPILKWLVAWRQAQMTLFQFDIMRLFHSVVEGAVHTTLDELRAEQGLRPLEAYERRPVLSGFYAAMRPAAPSSGTLSAVPLGAVENSIPDSATPDSATPASPVLPIARRVAPPAEMSVVSPEVPGLEGECAGA